MQVVSKVFPILSIVVTLLCMFVFFGTIGDAKGAPQEASLSAMVMTVMIAFYILARCVEMLGGKKADA